MATARASPPSGRPGAHLREQHRKPRARGTATSAEQQRNQEPGDDHGEIAARACGDLRPECRSTGQRDRECRAGDSGRQHGTDHERVGDAATLAMPASSPPTACPTRASANGASATRTTSVAAGNGAARTSGGGVAPGTGPQPYRARNASLTLSRSRPSPSAARKTSSSEAAAWRARSASGSPRSMTTPSVKQDDLVAGSTREMEILGREQHAAASCCERRERLAQARRPPRGRAWRSPRRRGRAAARARARRPRSPVGEDRARACRVAGRGARPRPNARGQHLGPLGSHR